MPGPAAAHKQPAVKPVQSQVQIKPQQPSTRSYPATHPATPQQNPPARDPSASPAPVIYPKHNLPAANLPGSNGKNGVSAPHADDAQKRTTPQPNNATPSPANRQENTPAAPPANGTNGNGKNGRTHPSQLFQPSRYMPPREAVKPASQTPAEPPIQRPLEAPSQMPVDRPVEKPASPPQPAALPAAAVPQVAPQPAPRRPGSRLHALKQLLDQQPDLPAQTAVLGVCDDGYPVLLDLFDPAPGAVIAIGDEREELLDLLRVAVSSIASRSTPRSVQMLIVTCDPPAWQEWIQAQGYERYCMGIIAAENADAQREWILQLGDWTEQRREGQRSGPPVLLVMDTLSFLPRLDYDVRLNFDWLVKEGPAAQIWPLAAISSDLALALGARRMLRAFRTRVFGFTADPAFYVQQANIPQTDAQNFGRPGEFAVQLGGEWMRFHLPAK